MPPALLQHLLPLALGMRIRAKQGQDARTAILYHKGAWVLHMLRNLMLDPRTLRDDRFAAFLREAYQTYRGRSMTTQDVRLLAEKHADEELAWFFRQWVEGTAIPSYRWAWHKEKRPDGRWTVGIRVRASDVPDDFRMPIPVRIDLGEGRSVRYRVEVAGRSGESSLEGLEFEPRQIGFNDLAAVLCEAKEEAW
jgi:aminopeptidase N